MFKKLAFLSITLIVLAIACKKDNICSSDYYVTDFEIKANSENRGLYDQDGYNSGDTIRSRRNQFYFYPVKSYISGNRSGFSLELIPSAYARDCAPVERSLTSFDPSKTVFAVDTDVNLSVYGLSGIIPAGSNLLDNQDLRKGLLSDIVNNPDLHAGINIPITVANAFLVPFKGQARIFTLGLVTASGVSYTHQVSVVIDVNA